jgi:hypothetical protein
LEARRVLVLGGQIAEADLFCDKFLLIDFFNRPQKRKKPQHRKKNKNYSHKALKKMIE